MFWQLEDDSVEEGEVLRRTAWAFPAEVFTEADINSCLLTDELRLSKKRFGCDIWRIQEVACGATRNRLT